LTRSVPPCYVVLVMMTPLTQEDRSRGGSNRDANSPEWAKAFMATLAASSRPLKRDNPAKPEQIVETLYAEAAKFPWIVFVAVGVDGRTVRSTVAKDVAVSRINLMRGCIGFAGVIWFNKRLVIFTRPLKAGPEAQAGLQEAADKLKAFSENFFSQEIQKRVEKGKL
jgi:hypothetical protein